MSDGITVDDGGNVILTDVEHGGLMSLDPSTGELTNLVRSKDIEWVDGVWTGPDHALYFTDRAIPHYNVRRWSDEEGAKMYKTLAHHLLHRPVQKSDPRSTTR